MTLVPSSSRGSGGGSGTVTAVTSSNLFIAVANGTTTPALSIGGSSFPGSPGSGDLYFRSDLGLIFYYDGTRWLTVNEYNAPFGNTVAASASFGGNGPYQAMNFTLDAYIEKLYATTDVLTTNDGTNNWTLTLNKVSTANALTPLGNFTTAADTHDTWASHVITVNAALVNGSFPLLRLDGTKNGAPGNLYCMSTLTFRLIGT